MSEHVTTIWHNASRVGQEMECEEKIKHPRNCQNKRCRIYSDSFSGPNSEDHLTVILEKDAKRLVIEVRSQTVIHDVSHPFEKDSRKKKIDMA